MWYCANPSEPATTVHACCAVYEIYTCYDTVETFKILPDAYIHEISYMWFSSCYSVSASIYCLTVHAVLSTPYTGNRAPPADTGLHKAASIHSCCSVTGSLHNCLSTAVSSATGSLHNCIYVYSTYVVLLCTLLVLQ